MPTYVYECEKCGRFEQYQSISEPALARCPQCRGKVQRIITGGTVIIKGGDACSINPPGGG